MENNNIINNSKIDKKETDTNKKINEILETNPYESIKWIKRSIIHPDKLKVEQNLNLLKILCNLGEIVEFTNNDYAKKLPTKFLIHNLTIEFYPHSDYYTIEGINFKTPQIKNNISNIYDKNGVLSDDFINYMSDTKLDTKDVILKDIEIVKYIVNRNK